jgi:hypothetical protein
VPAGALRAWAPHHWEPPLSRRQRRGLTIWLPVSLNEPEHAALGNQVGLIAVTLPCSDPSPLSRLHRIMAQADLDRIARTRRRQTLFNHVPYSWMCLARHAARWGSRDRLVVSTLSAVGTELPGARDIFPIPVLPAGVPAVAVFLNLGHTVTASLVVDDSLAGAEQLAPLLQQALEELAEMVRP